jgi:hypothetical protein
MNIVLYEKFLIRNKDVETTKQKEARRGKNLISPRNRKACHDSISTALRSTATIVLPNLPGLYFG